MAPRLQNKMHRSAIAPLLNAPLHRRRCYQSTSRKARPSPCDRLTDACRTTCTTVEGRVYGVQCCCNILPFT